MTPRNARTVDYVPVIKTGVALVRGFLIRNRLTMTTTTTTTPMRGFTATVWQWTHIAAGLKVSWVEGHADESYVWESKRIDLKYAAMEGETVKTNSWIMSLQSCLYSVCHHPLFDEFKLCIHTSVAGVVSESSALWSTAMDRKAGLNQCSLTEQTVYSAKGGLGFGWHVDKYYVRAPRRVLGERAAGK